MRYYRIEDGGDDRLAATTGGDVYDLTAVKPRLRTFDDLQRASSIAERSADDIAASLVDDAPTIDEDVLESSLTSPVRAEEVWAAGVTYAISEQAREAESSMPDMYLEVYDSERPEVFFKATPSRTVGPNDTVGIRADSEWDVPEPELGVVLTDGEIVGYTIGNDMSSRSIEGENPLYLPQAKVYDRCCSLGPCVTSAESITDPHALEMWMTIERDGEVMYDESTNTGEMARTVQELVDYYTRHNTVPETAVLLTGTSLVPSESFTLQEGDVVDIGIDEIGTLTNTVVEV
ncbi:fumarylacetoacetate hydrolase family protein [Halomontanus rarus]|uniref:fumarylacetoacetate hydrolase family protein n=1 Tax=Halomontanus rarus TaxID=3034020 RepID=UPI001A999842